MSIKILSHRGYWKTADEKNMKSSFRRSFSLSFGTETDIRDLAGTLVISHDPPIDNQVTVEEFLLEYINHGIDLPLALNIKSDGLQNQLKNLLEKFSIKNYFVFDMSIPDTLSYIQSGMNVFIRQSEYERIPVFLDQAKGVWLDSFEEEWYDESTLSAYVKRGIDVCIVSPELHGRYYLKLWHNLRRMNVLHSGQIMICTDLPEHAREFFNA